MSANYNPEQISDNYNKLIKLLINKKMSITTMESATGGLIASLITDSDGAAAVIKGAFVTYCNDAKISLGIPAQVIERYSVYSIETACEMAELCRKIYNADIGIGVTGTLGDVDSANVESSVPGCVYFAFSIRGELKGFFREIPTQPTRVGYKFAVAEQVVDELLKIIS